MMWIFNGSPKDVRVEYHGRQRLIKKGTREKFEDGQGKFILQKWGQRGLAKLEYGDKIEEIAEQCQERHNEFCRMNVIRFNQHNEANRNQKIPYVFPTKEQKWMAKHVGMDLMGPFSHEDASSSNQEIAKQKAEIDGLKGQMNQLMSMVQQMINLQAGNAGIDLKSDHGIFKDEVEESTKSETEKQQEAVKSIVAVELEKAGEVDKDMAPSYEDQLIGVIDNLDKWDAPDFKKWVNENGDIIPQLKKKEQIKLKEIWKFHWPKKKVPF